MVPGRDVQKELVSFAVTGLQLTLSHQFSHIVHAAQDAGLVQFNSQSGCSIAMFETLKGRSNNLLKVLLSFLALRRTTAQHL